MENKTGIISLIFLVISGVLFFLESPYNLLSILTFLAAINIPIIKGMWEVSGWASNQYDRFFGNDNVTISYSFDENSKNE